MDGVVERLRRIDWAGLGVELVIVFGSALRRVNPRDVDLLVFLRPGVDVDDAVLAVMEAVERAVGLRLTFTRLSTRLRLTAS